MLKKVWRQEERPHEWTTLGGTLHDYITVSIARIMLFTLK